jgi:tripartite-type tricarboxylate transporter receptor subunit TctC
MKPISCRSLAVALQRRGARRMLACWIGAAAVVALAPGHSWAQGTGASGAWPSKPIRLIHPWAAGGGGDIVARLLAEKMQAELGQPVIVENRAGAGGNIGAQLAARQPADGYTIMTTAGGFAIAPALFKSLGYDAVKDFVPVTKMAIAPLLVLVRADSPLRTMADLVAMAKKDPKAVSYASFGVGSPSHMIGESINRQAGISMAHVPYSAGNAVTDLLGGQVTVAILDALSQSPKVKAGTLRALALNGAQRLPALPDVPTLTESGIPFDLVGWHAMFAPGRHPAGDRRSAQPRGQPRSSRSPRSRRGCSNWRCSRCSPPPRRSSGAPCSGRTCRPGANWCAARHHAQLIARGRPRRQPSPAVGPFRPRPTSSTGADDEQHPFRLASSHPIERDVRYGEGAIGFGSPRPGTRALLMDTYLPPATRRPVAGRRWCCRTAAPSTAAPRTATSSSRAARTTRRCTTTASASPRAATPASRSATG